MDTESLKKFLLAKGEAIPVFEAHVKRLLESGDSFLLITASRHESALEPGSEDEPPPIMLQSRTRADDITSLLMIIGCVDYILERFHGEVEVKIVDKAGKDHFPEIVKMAGLSVRQRTHGPTPGTSPGPEHMN